MDKLEALRALRPDIKSFRSVQEPAIDALIEGDRLLCLMPTGEGKSLIYQVVGIALETCTVVISPLVALMRQQSKELAGRGLSSVCLSGLDYRQQEKALVAMATGRMPHFLFTSPERIANDGFLEHVLSSRRDAIGLVVVDEAHCISQWGEGFRPAYRNIPSSLDRVFGGGWPRVLCLTATLNQMQQDQIRDDFGITRTIQAPTLWRQNLTLRIKNLADGKDETKDAELERILDEHRGEKVLVFVHRKYGNKGTTRTLDEKYRNRYEGVAHFDSAISDGEKEAVLEGFANGSVKVVFATSAFGMGVDIPDIRVVVNYLISETVEQYYQEVGRAGRDGLPAEGHLLYTNQSRRGRLMLLRSSLCTEGAIRRVWDDYRPQGRAKIRCANYEVMSEEDRAAFSLLVDQGVFRVLAKGLQSLDCLTGSTPKGQALVAELRSHTKRSASTILCAKKSGRDIASLAHEIWEHCANGDVRMCSSPSKGIFYEVGCELDDEVVSRIIADQEAKKVARVKKFEEFADAIEAGSDPDNESGETAERLVRHELGILGGNAWPGSSPP